MSSPDTPEELRDELEQTVGVMQAVINKLNQLIEGEISEDDYREWVDNNERMFNEVTDL